MSTGGTEERTEMENSDIRGHALNPTTLHPEGDSGKAPIELSPEESPPKLGHLASNKYAPVGRTYAELEFTLVKLMHDATFPPKRLLAEHSDGDKQG
eukprot:12913097-Alexandrium_andersonii.AAC.1